MILPNIKFIKLNLDQLDTDYKKKNGLRASQIGVKFNAMAEN